MTTPLPWNVVHVSMRDPLPDLEVDPTVGGLLLVFWWDRLPLGQLSLPGSLLPVSSDQLLTSVASIIAPAVGQRLLKCGFDAPLPVPEDKQPRRAPPLLSEVLALDRPLTSLSRSACGETSTAAGPTVSVVVCTRNRPEHLERCLASVCALEPAPHEILVVDNDPSSGVTRGVTDRFQAVRYVAEPRAGLSIARNRGVLSCTGDIVAFTDDDVEVHAGWLDAIRSEFRNKDVTVLTGLVLPAELKTPAQQAFQSDALGWGWGYESSISTRRSSRRQSVWAYRWRIGAGANMVFDVKSSIASGSSRERLGAGASGCSEDSELCTACLQSASGAAIRQRLSSFTTIGPIGRTSPIKLYS